MIFEVLTRYGDTCGNEDQYHFCFVEASTKEEVEKVYPHGAFCGFIVREVVISSLPTKVQKVPAEY